jgi:hypothetical protein
MRSLQILGGGSGRRLPRKQGGSRAGERVGKEPERGLPVVPRIRGQLFEQPPGGRLEEFGRRLEVVRLSKSGEGVGFGGIVEERGELDIGRRGMEDRERRRAALQAEACTANVARDEPVGPERGEAASGAGLKGGGTMVGTEGAARVGGQEPFFGILKECAGDASEEGGEGARGELPAGIREIESLHLPINDVAAAGAKGAERELLRQRGGLCGGRGDAAILWKSHADSFPHPP